MASLQEKTTGNKWINATVAIGALLLGYIITQFVSQLGEWFDLEAKVQYFGGWAQGLGVAFGLVGFIVVTRNPVCIAYLQEVYGELTKVIWPEKEGVVKLTVGIIIGVVLLSVILSLIDLAARHLLGYLY